MTRAGILGLVLAIAAGASSFAAERPAARLAEQGRLVEAGMAAGLPTSVDDAGWEGMPAFHLTLHPQSAVEPGLPEARPVEATARVAVSGNSLAIRLDWTDPGEDRYRWDDTASFADAAAVQFGSFGKPVRLPYVGMGEPGRPVRLWFWRAGRGGAEALDAEGFGSLRRAAGGVPDALGLRREGGWRLMFSGPLPSGSAGLLPLSVAVWDGAQSGRDGRKWLSAWTLVRLPGRGQDAALARALLDEAFSTGNPARGAALAKDLGCGSCHTLPGAQRAEAGPDLTHAGSHHWPGYLRRSIAAPSDFIVPKPHFAAPGDDGRTVSAMPSFDLSAEAREDLVGYLASLR